MDILIFGLMPILQVGINYWISFQGVLTLAVLFKFNRILLPALVKDFPLKAATVTCMFVPLVLGGTTSLGHDFLMFGREILMFLLTVSIVGFLPGRAVDQNPRRSVVIALISVATVVALLAIQSVFTPLGIFVGIPQSYFAVNGDTATDAARALLSATYGGRIRPTGTFGEPSFCAYFLVSVFVMFHRGLQSPDQWLRRSAAVLTLTIVLGGLMTGSATFVVSLLILSYVAFARRINLRRLVVPGLIGIVVVASAFELGLLNDFVGRIVSASADNIDPSTMSRVVAPAAVIVPYLLAHPFGTPFSRLADVLDPYAASFGFLGSEITPNAVFGLLFIYGIFGFLVLGMILRSGGDMVFKVYLLLALAQNGAFLSIDKFSIVCLTAFYYESSKRSVSPVRAGGARSSSLSASNAQLVA